eukprot:GHVN01066024.1.p1 GENE.GHVN01066024.1~~GHVN01066024.1.p1  ORF type:complete len:1089 (-),score=157.92 GHVN01066024.1:6451-9717(-)
MSVAHPPTHSMSLSTLAVHKNPPRRASVNVAMFNTRPGTSSEALAIPQGRRQPMAPIISARQPPPPALASTQNIERSGPKTTPKGVAFASPQHSTSRGTHSHLISPTTTTFSSAATPSAPVRSLTLAAHKAPPPIAISTCYASPSSLSPDNRSPEISQNREGAIRESSNSRTAPNQSMSRLNSQMSQDMRGYELGRAPMRSVTMAPEGAVRTGSSSTLAPPRESLMKRRVSGGVGGDSVNREIHFHEPDPAELNLSRRQTGVTDMTGMQQLLDAFTDTLNTKFASIMNMMEEYDVDLSSNSEAEWDPAVSMIPPSLRSLHTKAFSKKQQSDLSSSQGGGHHHHSRGWRDHHHHHTGNHRDSSRKGTFVSSTSNSMLANSFEGDMPDGNETETGSGNDNFAARMANIVADLQKQKSRRQWEAMINETGFNPKIMLREARKRGHPHVRIHHIFDDDLSVESDPATTNWTNRPLEARTAVMSMRRRASTGDLGFRKGGSSHFDQTHQTPHQISSMHTMRGGVDLNEVRTQQALALDNVSSELRTVLKKVKENNVELAEKYSELETSKMSLSRKYKDLWQDYHVLMQVNGCLREELASVNLDNKKLFDSKLNLECENWDFKKKTSAMKDNEKTKGAQINNMKKEISHLLAYRSAMKNFQTGGVVRSKTSIPQQSSMAFPDSPIQNSVVDSGVGSYNGYTQSTASVGTDPAQFSFSKKLTQFSSGVLDSEPLQPSQPLHNPNELPDPEIPLRQRDATEQSIIEPMWFQDPTASKRAHVPTEEFGVHHTHTGGPTEYTANHHHTAPSGEGSHDPQKDNAYTSNTIDNKERGTGSATNPHTLLDSAGSLSTAPEGWAGSFTTGFDSARKGLNPPPALAANPEPVSPSKPVASPVVARTIPYHKFSEGGGSGTVVTRRETGNRTPTVARQSTAIQATIIHDRMGSSGVSAVTRDLTRSETTGARQRAISAAPAATGQQTDSGPGFVNHHCTGSTGVTHHYTGSSGVSKIAPPASLARSSIRSKGAGTANTGISKLESVCSSRRKSPIEQQGRTSSQSPKKQYTTPMGVDRYTKDGKPWWCIGCGCDKNRSISGLSS